MRAIGRPETPCGVDEILLLHGEHTAMDDPRKVRPVDDRDDTDDDAHPRLEHRNQGQSEQQGWQAHQDVGEAHQGSLDGPAEVSGGQADEHADQHRQAVGEDADRERDPGAEDQPAQEIAADVVGPQQKAGSCGRSRTAGRQGLAHQADAFDVAEVGVVRRQHRGAERDDEQDADDPRTAKGRPVLPQALPGVEPVGTCRRRRDEARLSDRGRARQDRSRRHSRAPGGWHAGNPATHRSDGRHGFDAPYAVRQARSAWVTPASSSCTPSA